MKEKEEIKFWKDKYYTAQKVFCEHIDRVKLSGNKIDKEIDESYKKIKEVQE